MASEQRASGYGKEGAALRDRASTIAAFIRICRHADRREMVRAIILRWPDLTGDELLRAARLASGHDIRAG